MNERLLAAGLTAARLITGRRFSTAGIALLLALLALFASRSIPTSASPSFVPAPETRETILALAEEAVYGQWVSPVTVTRDTSASPIRWGSFTKGVTYTGEAYTQQNSQESWPTFLANMTAGIGTPGVDQGTDCAGFASFVWQIPRQSSTSFITSGSAYYLSDWSELIRGDGLLRNSGGVNHIAIYYDRLESGLVVVLHQTDPKAERKDWSWTYASTYAPVRRVNVADTNTVPTAPTLRAPVNNAVVTNRTISFEWAASPTVGVDGYRIRVADAAAKVATGPWLVNEQLAATSLSRTLAGYGDYWWTVQACKECSTADAVYSASPGPWKVSVKPPTTYWQVEYFADATLTTPCHAETLSATHLYKDWPSAGPGGTCPADGFSARLSRRVTFQAASYAFTLVADDRGRLKLDGNTLLELWPTTTSTATPTPTSITASKTQAVTAGEHVLVLEFADLSGLARLYAYWAGPGFDLPRETKDPAQWYGEYWPNNSLWGESVARKLEGSGPLAKNWLAAGPGWGLPSDQFSARFERTVYFPCGTYRFNMSHNNGARLLLDGTTVAALDHWSTVSPDAAVQFSADLRIATGDHTLKVVYYESTGNASLSLDWVLVSACPVQPSAASPSSGTTDASLAQTLAWTGGDPEGEAVTYSVYLDPVPTDSAAAATFSPSTLVCQGSATSCDPLPGSSADGSPVDLSLGTRYIWRVVATDTKGNSVTSPRFDFTTVATCPQGTYRAEYSKGGTPGVSPLLVRCETPSGSGGSSLYARDWAAGGPALPVTPWTSSGSLGADDFALRFEGTFDFPASAADPTKSALFGFHATADDGVRLWVDGSLLLDGWKVQAPTSYRAVKELSPGVHSVKVEYFEDDAGASLSFGWDPLTACEGLPTGKLCALYFPNTILAGAPRLVVSENLPLVHSWASGGPSGLPADGFSALYLGRFESAAGLYQFRAKADDGVRLWVDGDLVLDGWKDQAPTTYQASRDLAMGEHQIRVEYYEKAGGAVLDVGWSLIDTDPCAGLVVGEYCGQYYNNKTLTAPIVLARKESSINYVWGAASPGPGVNVDGFSVRWQGTFAFDAATYTFTATTDDGLRVWVDGTQIFDDWTNHGPETYTASIPLSAGNHTVKMEYYENIGGAVAKLDWALQAATDPCAGLVTGQYCAEYFGNKTLTAPATLKVKEAAPLSHSWGAAGPGSGIPVDGFSARWTGTFSFPTAGTYTFTATSDDGVRVFVDDVSLIENAWYNHGSITYKVDRALSAGTHTVRVEYYENVGGAVAKLDWALKGQTTSRTEVIVDDKSGGFAKGGSYWREDTRGYLSHQWWTYTNGSVADSWGEWRTSLGGGSYEVFVYVPRYNTTSLTAKYTIYHSGGTTVKTVNQNNYIDAWVSLGTYTFDVGTSTTRRVRLTDATGEAANSKVLAFDAVRFTPR